jgi:signal transduction histidine kinase
MVVALNPATMSGIFAEQRLPPSWTGAVIDAGMRIAGRSRSPEQYIGRPATPSLAGRLAAAECGLFDSLNQEGDKVYTVFSRSPVTGWSVALGIPAAEVEKPIHHMLMMVAASAGILIVLGLILAGIVGAAIVRARRAYERDLQDSKSQLRDSLQELKHANVELEQFAHVVSHDLRQPLGMVRSYLGLIEKRSGATLSDDVKTCLDNALGGLEHMERLVVDVLNCSRNRDASEFGLVPLGEAVGHALRNLTEVIGDADADITVADEMPTVTGNPTELVRLLENLIGNAVKYRSFERLLKIDIGWSRRASEHLVWVKDNGSGIAPEDHEQAFEMFQRLSPRNNLSTGIGLAICKKIIEHHGGKIWIDSEIGKGCTFFMTFPLRSEGNGAEESRSAIANPGIYAESRPAPARGVDA